MLLGRNSGYCKRENLAEIRQLPLWPAAGSVSEGGPIGGLSRMQKPRPGIGARPFPFDRESETQFGSLLSMKDWVSADRFEVPVAIEL